MWFYVHFPPKWGVSVCRGTRLRFGQLWVLTLQKRQSGRETERHKSPKDKWAKFSKRVKFLFNIAKDGDSVEKKSSTKTQTELQWTLGSSSKNLSICVKQKKFVLLNLAGHCQTTHLTRCLLCLSSPHFHLRNFEIFEKCLPLPAQSSREPQTFLLGRRWSSRCGAA